MIGIHSPNISITRKEVFNLNGKKRKRKVIISSLLSLFVVLSLGLAVSAASSQYDCSYAGISCKGVKFTSYGSTQNHSAEVYAAKGQVLAVSNESTGPFNLVTRLVDSAGNAITGEIAFTDTQLVKVNKAGNYRVRVTCKDASTKKRCTGFGSVSQ